MAQAAKIIDFSSAKTEYYIKFEKRVILKAFKEHNIPLSVRGIYMQMGLEIEETNSSTFKASYRTLIEETGAAEDTLIKALKILKEKGFIHTHTQKGKVTSYTLLIGVYNGYKNSYPQPPLELGEVVPPKIGVPHVRVYNHPLEYKTNKQQQREGSVVVNFNFCKGSIFAILGHSWYHERTREYGSERVQKVITRLEQTYKSTEKIETSIEAVFISSLKDPNFNTETEKQRREREGLIKAKERANRDERDTAEYERNKELEREKRDQMLKTITDDYPQLLTAAKFEVENESEFKHPAQIQAVIECRVIAKYQKMKGWL